MNNITTLLSPQNEQSFLDARKNGDTQSREKAGLAMARSLFPNEIAVAATDPRFAHHSIFQQEKASIKRIQPGHQRAFAAGRIAAHKAMSELGLAQLPVVMGADRAPIWPEGVTGSLSHCQTFCVAALVPEIRFRALGVNVEESTGLAGDLFPSICTRAERAWIGTRPEIYSGALAKLILSAKKCAYKCQYVLSETLFGFNDIEVTPDLDTGQFEATFVETNRSFAAGSRLSGRFAVGNGLIFTAMALQS